MSDSPISYEEKVKLLELEDIIDGLYDKYIEKNKPATVLKLLNKMLDEIGQSHVPTIEKFRISIPDVKKMDGKKFVDENSHMLVNELKLDLNKDLKYNLAEKRVKYPLYILEALAECINYKVISKQTSITPEGESTHRCISKYRLEKENN